MLRDLKMKRELNTLAQDLVAAIGAVGHLLFQEAIRTEKSF